MPPKKKKTRPTAKSKSRPPQRRPTALIVVLLLVLVAGITGVKFFQSSRGRVVLLDAGFHGYYAQVQAELGEALKDGLDEFGLRRKIGEKTGFARTGGKTIHYLDWDIACGEDANLVLVNVGLTRAVKKSGGVVRRSEETDGGQALIFVVGSKKYDTHRLTLRKSRPAPARPAKRLPRLALVIDDLGYSRNGVVNDILSMDLPLTIAILPTLPYSTYALDRARAAGKCTMLHLPMEPAEPQGSDLEAVTTDMNDAAIARLVDKYVRSLPGIEGVNNHQGSLATTDERVVESVLGVIGEHGLFFFDSLTSSKSIAYNTAKRLGLRAAKNSVFLDDDTEEASVVEERLHRLVETAKKRGSAVGIGHPRAWTLEALKNNEHYFKNAGVELVYLSELVE